MYSPLILGTDGLGVVNTVGIGTFPVASVVGGSRVVEPVIGRGIDGGICAAGELGFKIDFSWKVSRSEPGERPPGDGRS